MTVIDAHQHFWDRSQGEFDYAWQQVPGLEKICRDFLPDDLRPQLMQTCVDRTILVQTQHNLSENRWALALAKSHDFIAGIVGWVDLTSPHCQQQLQESLQDPAFVGVRHVVQDEPDEDFIIRPDVLRGLSVLEQHGMPFDLLFYARHLRHTPTVAGHCPELPLVIDHLSKPAIKTGELKIWRAELRAAAGCENVYCKLSGLVTEADWDRWSIVDLRPYFETALECFGPERLMFGSDWPVCQLAASYDEVLTVTRKLIGELSPHEQSQIMGGTASRFYRLAATSESRSETP